MASSPAGDGRTSIVDYEEGWQIPLVEDLSLEMLDVMSEQDCIKFLAANGVIYNARRCTTCLVWMEHSEERSEWACVGLCGENDDDDLSVDMAPGVGGDNPVSDGEEGFSDYGYDEGERTRVGVKESSFFETAPSSMTRCSLKELLQLTLLWAMDFSEEEALALASNELGITDIGRAGLEEWFASCRGRCQTYSSSGCSYNLALPGEIYDRKDEDDSTQQQNDQEGRDEGGETYRLQLFFDAIRIETYHQSG